ncbi:MAG: hypothetical protein IRZ16_14835 [Myxococcaceae bacterium]|nr:hypothetical protein [Myxococcaceae bacterium]
MLRRFEAVFLILAAGVALPAGAASTLRAVPTASAAALELGGNGGGSFTRIVRVAELEVVSDNPRGVVVEISSGAIAKPGGDAVPFEVTAVLRGSPRPSAGDFLTPSGDTFRFVSPLPGRVLLTVYIRYTSAGILDPGTYSAALQISLSER